MNILDNELMKKWFRCECCFCSYQRNKFQKKLCECRCHEAGVNWGHQPCPGCQPQSDEVEEKIKELHKFIIEHPTNYQDSILMQLRELVRLARETK